MRNWSPRSRAVLFMLDDRLQTVLNRVLQEVSDISLVCGYRGEEDQEEAYATGMSTLRWPQSKHNRNPAIAIDLQPYPMPKTEKKLFASLGYIAGHLIRIGKEEGVDIRWGGDWNRNGDLTDQNFDDLFHFEIVE